MKPIAEFPHHKGRPTHTGPYCQVCKRAREKRAIAKARAPKADAHGPTWLQPPFGQYNDIKSETLTGVIDWAQTPDGWVEISGNLIRQPLPPDQANGALLVMLRDAFYEDGEEPEARVYLGDDGRVSFLVDRGAPGTYYQGEEITVRFDDQGNATQAVGVSV